MAANNMFSPSDADGGGFSAMGGDVSFDDVGKALLKYFKDVDKYVEKINKSIKDTVKETEKARGNLTGDTGRSGSGRLGLATVVKPALMAAAGASLVGMSMAPNTMAAVTQRMGADSYAGLSGMSSRRAILQANRQVGGGATSAMGPTMAAMNLMYQGGYTASSLSSKNIMGQLGGLSAMTGATNEQAAASFAGINGMSFLRAGVRVRDAQGNVRPPNQIINEVYNFLYRGQQITQEQAALVLNPGSKGYQSIATIAGGDQQLMQTIQMGIIARAAKGGSKGLTAAEMRNPNKMLDRMGVDKSSPIRANFRFQSSENKKLAATEQGLVGGYNASLRSTAVLNDGFSTMANLLGPINDGLMTLKGILETMPGAGNMGGTVSGLAGGAMGFAQNALIMGSAAKYLRGSSGAAGAVASGAKFAGKFGGLAKFGGKAIPGLGVALSVADGYNTGGGFSFRSMLTAAGTGAVAGGVAGSVGLAPGVGIGALIGALTAGGANAAGQLLGNRGGETAGMGGVTLPSGKDNTPGGSISWQLPVPERTQVSSKFGPRDNSKTPGISSNHRGVDYKLKENSNVLAAADGVVTEVGNGGGYGNYIIIKHGAKSSLYAHLNKALVSVGTKVRAGQIIAKSGGRKGAPGAGASTGPHLHFEIRDNGGRGAQGRVNPEGLLGKIGKSISGIFGKAGSVIKNFFTGKKSGTDSELFKSNQSLTGFQSSSDLSSPGISALLAGLTGSGAPISYNQVAKHLNDENMSSNGLIDNKLTAVSGDNGGMAGGSRVGLMRLLSQAGFKGKGLATAFAVALAESGGRAGAVGDVGLQDKKWGPSYGMFQIRSLKDWKAYNDPWRDGSRLKDPGYNARAAFIKSNGGTNFKAWSAYKNGAFAKFLDDAGTTASQAKVAIGGGTNELSSGLEAGVMTSRPGASTSVHTASNVNIKVNMNVNIARASVLEAEVMLKEFKKSLESELRLNRIGNY